MTAHTAAQRSRDAMLDRIETLETAIAAGLTIEDVQDNVGSMLTDTATIDLTYNDGPATVTASVIVAGLSGIAESQVTNLTTDLAAKQPLDTQLTSLAGLAYAGNALKVVRVNAGETDFELAAAAYRLLAVRKINQGTTSYTPTSGTTAMYIECIGGGGGGGGCLQQVTNNASGGGGGGGARSIKWATSFTAGAITVQVGAKGAGGAAGANNGAAGTDSTFDSASICTAKGGSGGTADTVATPVLDFGKAPGAGGLASSGVGDILFDGATAQYGLKLVAARAVGGPGAPGPYGGEPLQVTGQGAGTAARATAFGAGGGGGCIVSGGADVAGGNGADGIIIVWDFAAA